MPEPGSVTTNSQLPPSAWSADYPTWVDAFAQTLANNIINARGNIGMPSSWKYGAITPADVNQDGTLSPRLTSLIYQYAMSPEAGADPDVANFMGWARPAPSASDYTLTPAQQAAKASAAAAQSAAANDAARLALSQRQQDFTEAKWAIELAASQGSGGSVRVGGGYVGGGGGGGGGFGSADALELAKFELQKQVALGQLSISQAQLEMQKAAQAADMEERRLAREESARQFDLSFGYQKERDAKAEKLERQKTLSQFMANPSDAVAASYFLHGEAEPTGTPVGIFTTTPTGQTPTTFSENWAMQPGINGQPPAPPPPAAPGPVPPPAMARGTGDGWIPAPAKFITGDPAVPGVPNPELNEVRVKDGRPELRVTPLAPPPMFARGTIDPVTTVTRDPAPTFPSPTPTRGGTSPSPSPAPVSPAPAPTPEPVVEAPPPPPPVTRNPEPAPTLPPPPAPVPIATPPPAAPAPEPAPKPSPAPAPVLPPVPVMPPPTAAAPSEKMGDVGGGEVDTTASGLRINQRAPQYGQTSLFPHFATGTNPYTFGQTSFPTRPTPPPSLPTPVGVSAETPQGYSDSDRTFGQVGKDENGNVVYGWTDFSGNTVGYMDLTDAQLSRGVTQSRDSAAPGYVRPASMPTGPMTVTAPPGVQPGGPPGGQIRTPGTQGANWGTMQTLVEPKAFTPEEAANVLIYDTSTGQYRHPNAGEVLNAGRGYWQVPSGGPVAAPAYTPAQTAGTPSAPGYVNPDSGPPVLGGTNEGGWSYVTGPGVYRTPDGGGTLNLFGDGSEIQGPDGRFYRWNTALNDWTLLNITPTIIASENDFWALPEETRQLILTDRAPGYFVWDGGLPNGTAPELVNGVWMRGGQPLTPEQADFWNNAPPDIIAAAERNAGGQSARWFGRIAATETPGLNYQPSLTPDQFMALPIQDRVALLNGQTPYVNTPGYAPPDFYTAGSTNRISPVAYGPGGFGNDGFRLNLRPTTDMIINSPRLSGFDYMRFWSQLSPAQQAQLAGEAARAGLQLNVPMFAKGTEETPVPTTPAPTPPPTMPQRPHVSSRLYDQNPGRLAKASAPPMPAPLPEYLTAPSLDPSWITSVDRQADINMHNQSGGPGPFAPPGWNGGSTQLAPPVDYSSIPDPSIAARQRLWQDYLAANPTPPPGGNTTQPTNPVPLPPGSNIDGPITWVPGPGGVLVPVPAGGGVTPPPSQPGVNTGSPVLNDPTVLRYNPDVYQNLPVVRYLRGLMGEQEFQNVSSQPIYAYLPDANGVRQRVELPSIGSMNWTNLERIRTTDPAGYQLLMSLYAAANVPLDSAIAMVQDRAPRGVAYEPTLIST